jgi:hypothetical protein
MADAKPSGLMVNSVGLFMLQCRSVPAAASALKQLDSKIVREYSPDPAGTTGAGSQPSLPTAFDGWGHPIRYVHPMTKGLVVGPQYPTAMTDPTMFVDTDKVLGQQVAPRSYAMPQIRRNATPPDADSDGGINPGTRPYFYSAGPDGDPSTVDDNVYLTVPRTLKN